MMSVRCMESLDLSLKQIEEKVQHSRAKLIKSIKNNNWNQNELEHYKQLSHQLNQRMIQFNELLAPSTNISHCFTDDIHTTSNSSSFKYSLNDDLHRNNSQTSECSDDLPKYPIGESLTSSIGGDLLILANSSDQQQQQDEREQDEQQQKEEQKEKAPSSKVSSIKNNKQLYKYGGTGFEFFTNNKSNFQPVYASTRILCKTNHNDKERLIQSMVNKGHFESEMIEAVRFKIETAYHNNYAMIRLRGELNRISSNIKSFNKSFGDDTMMLYENRKYRKPINPNCTLKVNNFDILNKNTHKQFTDLISKFGDLYKDISMGLDNNGDPFAIVTFRDIKDAKKCHNQKNLRFCGRNLHVQYSKFQFIKNYF